MEFRLLGPFDVRHDGRSVPIAGQRTRTLLCALLLRADQVVSTERLIDDIWGDDPPAGAVHALHTQASKLRAALRDGHDALVISHTSGGYRAEMDGHHIDVREFERLVNEGRQHLAAGQPDLVVTTMRSAEALCRGAPLADFAGVPFAQPMIVRLEEMHRFAVETRIEAQLACGDAFDVLPELEERAAADPLREQVRRLHMLALYRTGHQARALDVYRQTRELLADELGVDPSPELQQLMQAILTQDPSLTLPSPRAEDRFAVDVPRPEPPADLRTRPRPRRRWRALVIAAAVAALVIATAAALIPRHRQPAPAAATAANVVTEFNTSGRLIKQFPVGKNPTAVTAGAGSLWVSNSDDNSISRIDPRTGASTPISGVGESPAGVVVGAGSAWVVSPTNPDRAPLETGTVTAINLTTDTPTDAVPAGELAGGIAYGDAHVWSTATEDAKVYRFDPTHPGQPVEFDTGAAPTALAATSQALWVANAGDNTVWKIDPASGQRQDVVNVGTDPVAVAAGANGVWVANHLSGDVTLIDPNLDQPSSIPVGDGPSSIAITPNAVWVTTSYAGRLVKIDPRKRRAVASFPVPGAPQSVTAVGDRLFVASAASYQGHRGGALRIRMVNTSPGPGYPITDPGFDADTITLLIGAATTDTLVANVRAPGPAGDALTPDLAMAIPRPTAGQTEYVFQLRPGIRFSTGQLVQASDVRASIERGMLESQESGSPIASIRGAAACFRPRVTRCDLSKAIEVNDATRTVRIELSHPDPQFLYALAGGAMAIVPKATPTYSWNELAKQHPVVPGTGPYRVSKLIWPRFIELTRNPHFHMWSRAAHPNGYVNTIDIEVAAPSPHDLTDLEQGRIDVLDDRLLTPSAEQAAVNGHALVAREEAGVALRYLVLNSNAAPFNNLKARQALNYAINRQTAIDIEQSQTTDQLAITCQVIPAGMVSHQRYCPYTVHPSGSGAWTAADLDRARQLVSESGTKDEPVTVWAPPVDHPGNVSPDYVVSVLDDIGYRARAYRPSKTWTVYETDLESKKKPAQVGLLGQGFWPDDGAAAIESFTCGQPYTGNYCNRALDSAYRRGLPLMETDPQAARDTWTALDKQLVDDAVIVPLWNATQKALVSTRVGNWTTGIQPDELWVQ
jgi:peptide/nickel transport system substrate-binding protein